MMTRFCWWLVDLGSRMLEPDERDVVRGDLTESRASGGRAVREVFGLVVRRQAALWLDWRPWLAVVGVVVPLGMLLSHVSRSWADGSAVYAFIYVNSWTAFLDSPGGQRDLLQFGARVILIGLTLIGWSWTCGFVLGSLSRRVLWLTAPLFLVLVFGGTMWSTPTTARANPFNDPVFSLTFYRVMLPRLLRFGLVLLPALWGVHTSFRRPSLPAIPTIAGALAILMLTAWGSMERPLLLVMAWPAMYMTALACVPRCRARAMSA